MAYQNVTKQQIINAVTARLNNDLDGYPDNVVLDEEVAEAMIFELTEKAYNEACKTVNPDKTTYPPVRF